MTAQGLALLLQVSLVLTIGGFAFFVTCEDAPADPAANRRWRHLLRNGGLFLLALLLSDVLLLRPELGLTTRPVASPGLLTPLALPLAVQIVGGCLLLDLYHYTFHRLAHRWRWLWLFHAVHHSDPTLDTSTGLRFHPVESVLNSVVAVLLLLALGLPLWLLFAQALVVNPLNYYQHANLRTPEWVPRRLGWLVVTPPMHRLHHSPDPAATNSNYGVVLSCWDRLFGTYRAPVAERPAAYGLRRLAGDAWQSIGGMLLTPWRARGLGPL
jgi:sterol desaturase/sphingolipid hydroxylase (fatty acid hydroxylase superfamily)